MRATQVYEVSLITFSRGKAHKIDRWRHVAATQATGHVDRASKGFRGLKLVTVIQIHLVTVGGTVYAMLEEHPL